jgi:4,5-dihydroxyphthalate decarboxylase
MAENLSIVLGPHGQVADLRSGAVTVDDCDLQFVDASRMPDAYRDMARSQPYDICEMAPAAYLMAVAAGAPITALPLPMTRRFRHAGLQRPAGSDLRTPKDIEGRRVGVRTYAVTAGVWTRGIYADEFGVDPAKVTWLTAEDENVQSAPLPANVHRIDPGTSLADLLRNGELDAVYGGLAGVGASGAGASVDDELIDLVSNSGELERQWFERTGIYPLHGVIVIRNDVLDRLPRLPAALFDAFARAKRNYLQRIESGAAAETEDRRYLRLSELVGDPLPYGLEENAESLAALVRYARRQGLVAEEPPIENLFPDPRTAGQLARRAPEPR